MRTFTLFGLAVAINLGLAGSGLETGAPTGSSQAPSTKPPLRLKVGDTIAVTSPYGGEFRIQNDGAIYGRGFGRLMLEGKSWEEALTAVRRALRPFVREDEVHLTLRDLRREVVYLVGLAGGRGPIELSPDLTLKKLMASVSMDFEADRTLVQLFRSGVKKSESLAAKLVAGDPSAPDQNLQAEDVVALSPAPFVRIWVTGLAVRPGQHRVPAGTDVYRAIAEAGGVRGPELQSDASWIQYGRVLVQRGPETTELPLKEDRKRSPMILEAGDTISIQAPEEVRVTIAGEVVKPGEILLRGDRSLTAGLAQAGGANSEGTLAMVRVLRHGEVFQIGVGKSPDVGDSFRLEPGDLVYVPRNERSFLVLGDVARPGRVLMKDGRPYRLSDALAEAGGLAGKGTMRRVYLCRPDGSGKFRATQFHLDEFFKDGKAASNPDVMPGDCLLFGQPKGISISSISQVLSGALMIDAISGGRS